MCCTCQPTLRCPSPLSSSPRPSLAESSACLGTRPNSRAHRRLFQPISGAGTNIWSCHGCQDGAVGIWQTCWHRWLSLRPVPPARAAPCVHHQVHHQLHQWSPVLGTNDQNTPFPPIHLFTRPLLQHPVPIQFSPSPLFDRLEKSDTIGYHLTLNG